MRNQSRPKHQIFPDPQHAYHCKISIFHYRVTAFYGWSVQVVDREAEWEDRAGAEACPAGSRLVCVGERCSAEFRLALRQDPDDPGPTAHVQSSDVDTSRACGAFEDGRHQGHSASHAFWAQRNPQAEAPGVKVSQTSYRPRETRTSLFGELNHATNASFGPRSFHPNDGDSTSSSSCPTASVSFPQGTLPRPRDPCHVGLRGGPGRAATPTREARLCEKEDVARGKDADFSSVAKRFSMEPFQTDLPDLPWNAGNMKDPLHESPAKPDGPKFH